LQKIFNQAATFCCRNVGNPLVYVCHKGTVTLTMRFGKALEEFPYRDLEAACNFIKHGRADTVFPVLVFLHLLKANANTDSKIALRYVRLDPAYADLLSDVKIDRMGCTPCGWRLGASYPLRWPDPRGGSTVIHL
jgi:hypothetical protein